MKYIELTQNKKAIIDDDDLERVSKYKWYWHKGNGYAVRNQYLGSKGQYKTIFLHKFIMGNTNDSEVDHINSNQLDNRKLNLRPCSHQQNCINRRTAITNTSGYRGVSFVKHINRWKAQITFQGKKIYMGVFNDKLEAALTYDRIGRNLCGEFFKPNFI